MRRRDRKLDGTQFYEGFQTCKMIWVKSGLIWVFLGFLGLSGGGDQRWLARIWDSRWPAAGIWGWA
ncbi:hypothetical protein A2U01_0060909 [Trifolium medium]|uniref:Uncharacterized protein n=1 Tax=Trifolium medium TaxID=97028 RepID=A0A392RU58_9FABA|nr:hypothetical protein [Trifolium medium]